MQIDTLNNFDKAIKAVDKLLVNASDKELEYNLAEIKQILKDSRMAIQVGTHVLWAIDELDLSMECCVSDDNTAYRDAVTVEELEEFFNEVNR